MLSELWNNLLKKSKEPANGFVLRLVLAYGIWKAFYAAINMVGGPIQQGWTNIVFKLGKGYAAITSAVLNTFGEATLPVGKTVYFYLDSKNILIEEHCLALPAMFIFTAAILLFGGNWRGKLMFIPLGLLGVGIINLFRLVSLSYVFVHFRERFFVFHHEYLYVAFTYGLILSMIIVWMKYFRWPQSASSVK